VDNAEEQGLTSLDTNTQLSAIRIEEPAYQQQTAMTPTSRGVEARVIPAIDNEEPFILRATLRPPTRRGGRPPVVPVAVVNRNALRRATTTRGGRPPLIPQGIDQRAARPRTRTRRQVGAIQVERVAIADIIIEEVYDPVIGPLAMIRAPKCPPKVEVFNLILNLPQDMPIFDFEQRSFSDLLDIFHARSNDLSGVWCPPHVYHDKRLSEFEMTTLIEIRNSTAGNLIQAHKINEYELLVNGIHEYHFSVLRTLSCVQRIKVEHLESSFDDQLKSMIMTGGLGLKAERLIIYLYRLIEDSREAKN